jgi:hypothetical protein
MSRPLAGKVAIVTGAATGIGQAIAITLASAGARVVVNHLNTPDLAEAVVSQVADEAGEAIAVAADVSKRSDFAALIDAASLASTGGTSWSTTPRSRWSSLSRTSPKTSSTTASRSTSKARSTAANSRSSAWPTVGGSSTSRAQRRA